MQGEKKQERRQYIVMGSKKNAQGGTSCEQDTGGRWEGQETGIDKIIRYLQRLEQHFPLFQMTNGPHLSSPKNLQQSCILYNYR